MARSITRSYNRRAILFALTATVGAVALAACSAPAPTATPAPAAKPAAPATAAPAAQPAQGGAIIELTMWGNNSQTHWPSNQYAEANFPKKFPNIKIKLEPSGNTLAASTAGNLPDVFEALSKGTLSLWKQKVIREVDSIVYKPAGIKPDEVFFPGAHQGWFHDGKYWGVPTEDNHVGWGIHTRLDAWTEASLTFPVKEGFKDWDEYYTTAQKLMKKDSSGNIVRYGYQAVDGWCVSYVMQAMMEMGGNYWDDAKKTFTMDTDIGIKAITKTFWDPVHKYGIEHESLGTNSRDSVIKNKVASCLGTPTLITVARQDNPNLIVDSCLHPTMGPKYIVVGEGAWGFHINAAAKQLDAAAKLLTWMCDTEFQVVWTKNVGGQQPGRKDVLKADFWNDPQYANGKRMLDVQDKGVYMTQGYDIGLPQEIQTRWTTIASDMRAKKLTVEEAAKKANQEFNKQREDFLKS